MVWDNVARKAKPVGRRLLSISLIGLTLWVSEVRADETTAVESSGHTPIVWVGTVMTNLIYMPAKLLYAGCGGLVGGLAYVLTAGDTHALSTIWDAAGGGTYLVTPSMLDGRDTAQFVGS